MKPVRSVILMLACIVLVYLGMVYIAGHGHHYESSTSKEEWRHAIELLETRPCTTGGQSDALIADLQAANPQDVIFLKGQDVVVNGFAFRCTKTESNAWHFVKNQ